MKIRRISKREFLKTSGMALLGAPVLWRGSWCVAAEKPSSSREVPARYFISTPRGIRCQLCPNHCTIKEGERGDCRTRINRNGELYTLAYGNPCAVHIDPIEKKPLNHFLPGTTSFSIATAGCNLACLNCQNWQISQKAPDQVKTFDLWPEQVVEQAVKNGCASIAYTYTEPIVFYEYAADTSRIAKEQGIRNVIVSAGYIESEPLRQWCKYIDAANIDLKSFSDEIYQRLNAGTLQPVLNTLKVLKEEGVWLEITNLVVPQWTDDLDMIKEMCDWFVENGFEDTPLHFSRFTPRYKLTRLPATPTDVLNRACQIARSAGMKYVYVGNVPGAEEQDTFCPSCGKKIIDRSGFRIVENHIEEGQCAYCGEVIAGVWK